MAIQHLIRNIRAHRKVALISQGLQRDADTTEMC